MSMASWQTARRTIEFRRRPQIVGIVNVTPDSFSDGGRYATTPEAVSHGLHLVDSGADMLDVGGESSRPGSDPVALEVELERVLPVVEGLRGRVDVPISIDTTKAAVAVAALERGCDIVNDISGLTADPQMIACLAPMSCGVIVMHMQGRPKTMQEAPHYDDVVAEVASYFQERLETLAAGGIAPERLVLDPGIGFGKRLEDNLNLLRNLQQLRIGERPILVGASRKSFLGKLLEEPEATRRLEGDLAVAAHCHRWGVDLIRVHDVRAVERLFRVLEALQT